MHRDGVGVNSTFVHIEVVLGAHRIGFLFPVHIRGDISRGREGGREGDTRETRETGGGGCFITESIAIEGGVGERR